MKIGLFTHSGNPRGGVVHALSVGAALAEAGHEVSVLAPLGSRGFFRTPRCRQVAMPVAAAASGARGSAERIGRQIGLLVQFLTAPGTPRFDVWHAGDPITANALGALVRLGAIDGFSRTVHHLDSYADPLLAAWQEAAVREAGALCCVSSLYQARLAAEFGRDAALVGNGVDRVRFSPVAADPEVEALARRRWPDGGGPRLLAFGGIEQRKNALGVLAGFVEARRSLPDATLLIAGGATLLDHAAYHAQFQSELAATGLSGVVRVVGVVPDAEVPALYRAADMLVSPSLAEGFGLAAIEAMACGVPAIVAARPPFTEHLRPGECLFVDPEDPAAIGRAIVAATRPETRRALSAAGITAASRFDWHDVAARHLPIFDLMSGRQAAHA